MHFKANGAYLTYPPFGGFTVPCARGFPPTFRFPPLRKRGRTACLYTI